MTVQMFQLNDCRYQKVPKHQHNDTANGLSSVFIINIKVDRQSPTDPQNH